VRTKDLPLALVEFVNGRLDYRIENRRTRKRTQELSHEEATHFFAWEAGETVKSQGDSRVDVSTLSEKGSKSFLFWL
jgi:hypothetical protein